MARPKAAVRPRLMDLVEVDRRGTQPARTGGGVPPHRRGDRAGRVELGRHERRARVLGQRVAEDALAAPEAAEPRRVDGGNAAHEGPAGQRSGFDTVDLRGVKERHAEFEGTPDDRAGVRSRVPLPRSSTPATRTARCPVRSWKSASRCRCSDTALGVSSMTGRMRRMFVKRRYTRSARTSPGKQ